MILEVNIEVLFMECSQSVLLIDIPTDLEFDFSTQVEDGFLLFHGLLIKFYSNTPW